MKFYDREEEMRILENSSRIKGKKLIVISGRRRIGKTRLVMEFSSGKKSVYFFVERKSEELLLRDFSQELSRMMPEKSIGTLSWEEFFRVLLENTEIVIFDEVQNLYHVNPGVYTTFQKVWDRYEGDAMVLFLGSYVGLMKRLFEDYKSPLYGRISGKIELKPMDFRACSEIMRDLGFSGLEEMLHVYSMLGGVPKYYEILENYGIKRWETAVRKLFVSGLRPLVDEPEIILIGEFGKEHKPYMSILEAVARGKSTMTKISDYTGIRAKSMGKYLEELTEYYRILERKTPVTEGERSKKGRYFLKDRLISFWFRYVRPNIFLIESGKEREFLERVKETYEDHTARVFEDLMREIVKKDMNFDKVGSWWNRRGDEIDIVALNERKKEILFGEVKWRNRSVGWNVVEELIEKKDLVKWYNEDRKEKFLIVSKAGFTKKCLERMEDEGIMHWDLRDLERLIQ
ncbi:MAG: DUF234 domain-containing protein [Candidatus Syntropharchaeia archaeon]